MYFEEHLRKLDASDKKVVIVPPTGAERRNERKECNRQKSQESLSEPESYISSFYETASEELNTTNERESDNDADQEKQNPCEPEARVDQLEREPTVPEYRTRSGITVVSPQRYD